jgi:hypothetical protein
MVDGGELGGVGYALKAFAEAGMAEQIALVENSELSPLGCVGA